MMAPNLLQLDTNPLEAAVNRSTLKREGSLSLLTTPQRELDSASVWQGSTVSENGRETGPVQITALDLQKKPKSASVHNLQTTEPLLGLHKHWMSVHQQHIYISLVFFAVGFSAITALAIAIVGWLPLDIAAYVLVWPSLIVWLVLGILYPNYGKLALKGFVIGLLACLFYDCMRFVTIELGLWGDFIPRISMLLFHTDKPDWVIGYIWRYIGDGGFMGVAFVVGYRLWKPKLDVRVAALSFGMVIWVCLVATILLAPQGTETLFPLTPVTLSLSLLGHVIYGLSIGLLYPVFIRESVPTRLLSANLSELPLLQSLPQAPEKGAIAPHSQPILITSSGKRLLTSQFVKPGFIDARYSARAGNFDAPV